MAYRVLILGNSGTGKSASLRNFKQDEVLVINCAGKPLPFKSDIITIEPSFQRLTTEILQAMEKTQKKVIVIDDAQYIMSFQYMRRIKENGWDKWNDIQGDFFNIIMKTDELPKDVTVYFLSHIQKDEDGSEKIKTMGKMLDEKITIEGLFTTVLKTSVQDGKYCFLTQNNGKDTVKSPIGMFDYYAIVNDLKYVDEKLRNYYGIDGCSSDEEVAELDKQNAAPEVEKPEADGRRRRRTATTEESKTEESDSKSEEPVEKQDVTSTDDSKSEDKRVRVRKDRTNGKEEEEKSAEAPTEEKEETTERKRRRRKATSDPTDISNFSSVSADEVDDLPFI